MGYISIIRTTTTTPLATLPYPNSPESRGLNISDNGGSVSLALGGSGEEGIHGSPLLPLQNGESVVNDKLLAGGKLGGPRGGSGGVESGVPGFLELQ